MEKSKHTPAPWTVKTEIEPEAGFTYDAFEIFNDEGEKIDASEANARLIAAAPELLDIAKMMVEWAKTNGSLTVMERRMLDDSRKAIAKAEGNQ